jgi:uncharacterized repeat protein (TIGR01451 family)
MEGWGKSLSSLAARIALAVLLGWLALPAAISAQTVNTYVNNTTGNLNNTTTCANPLVRNFVVGTNYTVASVELGVYATHSWRGDIRITLQSPAGTRVQVVDGNTDDISGNNFNVLLSDDGTQAVNTDLATGNHSATAPPPFEHNFIPDSALSAFAGQSSSGTWRLEICDLFPSQDNGSFQYAALYLTSAPANYADLSLVKAISSATPASGASITYTLTVASAAASPSNAAGVTVTDLLPAGVSYTGHSGFGTYVPGTGVWTVGTLTPGQSRTLTITATVTASAGATIANDAEVSASSVIDIDSTPNNGATGEDDYDAVSFTVSGSRVAGTPPNLICPKSTILFDWDTRAWTTGATNASYAVTGLGTMSFAITNQGAWLNMFGGNNPVRTNQATGGFTPAQYSLAETVNFASESQVATTTIALPLAVDGLQFRLFDVDYGANQFADRVTVTGTFNGSPVTPVLTNGVANYVIGNQAFGDAAAANDNAGGNVVVTFQSAVDTVVIEYGNHSLAPTDPGQQAITLHDITLCEPHADVTVTKISSVVSDPVSGGTNPMAIPGALLSYCVMITNSGSAAATAIAAADTLPGTLAFVPGSMRSGADCASAATVEDDNTAGADESDPIGASISGNQLQISAVSLAGSAAMVVKFDATVN